MVARRFAALSMDLDSHKALYERFAERLRRGESLGPEVSMLKIFQSELFQRISELGLEVAGEDSALLQPFAEDPELQARSVALFAALAAAPGAEPKAFFDNTSDYAVKHQVVIDRFGRFPHRNAILGRVSTPEEVEYLRQPGSGF